MFMPINSQEVCDNEELMGGELFLTLAHVKTVTKKAFVTIVRSLCKCSLDESAPLRSWWTRRPVWSSRSALWTVTCRHSSMKTTTNSYLLQVRGLLTHFTLKLLSEWGILLNCANLNSETVLLSLARHHTKDEEWFQKDGRWNGLPDCQHGCYHRIQRLHQWDSSRPACSDHETLGWCLTPAECFDEPILSDLLIVGLLFSLICSRLFSCQGCTLCCGSCSFCLSCLRG